MPLAKVFSVATFYRAFSLEPQGRTIVKVCTGTACHIRGAGQLIEELERQLGIKPGETTDGHGVHRQDRQLRRRLRDGAGADRRRQVPRRGQAGEGGRSIWATGRRAMRIESPAAYEAFRAAAHERNASHAQGDPRVLRHRLPGQRLAGGGRGVRRDARDTGRRRRGRHLHQAHRVPRVLPARPAGRDPARGRPLHPGQSEGRRRNLREDGRQGRGDPAPAVQGPGRPRRRSSTTATCRSTPTRPAWRCATSARSTPPTSATPSPTAPTPASSRRCSR